MVHFQYEWPKQIDIDRFIFLQGTKENNPGRFLVDIGLDISNSKRRSRRLRSWVARPCFLRLICLYRITCSKSTNGENIKFRDFSECMKGAMHIVPVYVTLAWSLSSSASFLRSINDRKPIFWRGTHPIPIWFRRFCVKKQEEIRSCEPPKTILKQIALQKIGSRT